MLSILGQVIHVGDRVIIRHRNTMRKARVFVVGERLVSCYFTGEKGNNQFPNAPTEKSQYVSVLPENVVVVNTLSRNSIEYCCDKCGSLDVNRHATVEANTQQFISFLANDEGWCNKCGTMCEVITTDLYKKEKRQKR